LDIKAEGRYSRKQNDHKTERKLSLVEIPRVYKEAYSNVCIEGANISPLGAHSIVRYTTGVAFECKMLRLAIPEQQAKMTSDYGLSSKISGWGGSKAIFAGGAA
jgi:hypothetical protein